MSSKEELRAEAKKWAGDADYYSEQWCAMKERAEAADRAIARLVARADAAEAERDALRAQVRRSNAAAQEWALRAVNAEKQVAAVRALADWFEAQENWREWGIHRQIRASRPLVRSPHRPDLLTTAGWLRLALIWSRSPHPPSSGPVRDGPPLGDRGATHWALPAYQIRGGRTREPRTVARPSPRPSYH